MVLKRIEAFGIMQSVRTPDEVSGNMEGCTLVRLYFCAHESSEEASCTEQQSELDVQDEHQELLKHALKGSRDQSSWGSPIGV